MNQKRSRIKELEVMVSDVRQETDDTVTLSLFTGNDTLPYQPGHFLTISPHQFGGLQRWVAFLEHSKGRKEPPRAYSLSSSPDENELAITVKEEQYDPGKTLYPPLLSPILSRRTPRGTRITITGFTGPYTLTDEISASNDHIVHICAGSGIVPSYSIIKHDLRTNDRLRHTLLYSNKTRKEIIFNEQLAELRNQFPDRFRIVHTLTRSTNGEINGEDVRQGRISRDLLEDLIPEPEAAAIFVCGPDHSTWHKKAARQEDRTLPPSFLQSVLSYLSEIGVAPEAITSESYG